MKPFVSVLAFVLGGTALAQTHEVMPLYFYSTPVAGGMYQTLEEATQAQEDYESSLYHNPRRIVRIINPTPMLANTLNGRPSQYTWTYIYTHPTHPRFNRTGVTGSISLRAECPQGTIPRGQQSLNQYGGWDMELRCIVR